MVATLRCPVIPQASPLSWSELEALAPPLPDRVNGPTNAQARLRLFGHSQEQVRVTLYRDHHAWCPYCQRVWLWLEESRIPYRVGKVSMVCYGDKEPWYRRLVPSGMVPAIELDGRLITESDRILEALEEAFGPLGHALHDPEVVRFRRLERSLFAAWCSWLCQPGSGADGEALAQRHFSHVATELERLMAAGGGPFMLGGFGGADVLFAPFLERMSASLAHYKGVLLRGCHPGLDRWFRAMEARPAYQGTQGDFHTHAHDLPPQMGGCVASGEPGQRQLAARINGGPWPIVPDGQADPETSQAEPPGAAALALARVLRHREALLARQQCPARHRDQALRCALTTLIRGDACPPPAATAAGLRELRDRICVPRDMPLHSARRLRQALEATARLDPADPDGQGPDLPLRHRRDQDPNLFSNALSPA
ncbi:MAG: glutathione S-transferase family protein [Synechococcaceae cyanobacterium]|jgi:glutathione S-transferase